MDLYGQTPHFDVKDQVRVALQTCLTRIAYCESAIQRVSASRLERFSGLRVLHSLATDRVQALSVSGRQGVKAGADNCTWRWYSEMEREADKTEHWRLCSAVSRLCRGLSFEYPFCFGQAVEDRVFRKVSTPPPGDIERLDSIRAHVLERLLDLSEDWEAQAIGFEISERALNLLSVAASQKVVGFERLLMAGLNSLEPFEDVSCMQILVSEAERWLDGQ